MIQTCTHLYSITTLRMWDMQRIYRQHFNRKSISRNTVHLQSCKSYANKWNVERLQHEHWKQANSRLKWINHKMRQMKPSKVHISQIITFTETSNLNDTNNHWSRHAVYAQSVGRMCNLSLAPKTSAASFRKKTNFSLLPKFCFCDHNIWPINARWSTKGSKDANFP